MRELTAQREQKDSSARECHAYLDRLARGEGAGPQAHLHRKAEPASAEYFRQGRLAELWAALSTGLILLAGAGLVALGFEEIGAALIILLGALLVDSILQRTVIRLLLNATIVLAVVAAGVMLYQFFWQIALATVVLVAIYVAHTNP